MALQLVTSCHIPAARLAACLGTDKRVLDARLQHTLLAFALAHCTVTPVGAVARVSSGAGADLDDDGLVAVSMTRLLEELQSCEKCYVSGERMCWYTGLCVLQA